MLSIIIPTLNEESVIGETIKKLKAGLNDPYEIIITDGGSKDQTIEIAKSLGAVVIEHKDSHRQTIAEGRNAGEAASKGDILIFLDADCEIVDTQFFFKTIIVSFEQNPQLVAMSPAIWVDPGLATVADRIIYWIVNTIPGAPGECQIIRRSAFEKVGGYRKELVAVEDHDLFFRLRKIGKTKFNGELEVYQTGRRAHKIGWPTLLLQWAKNFLSYTLRDKAASTEWTVVR